MAADRSMRRHGAVLTVVVTLLALLGIAAPAAAVVASATGQLIKISPPANVLQSGLCSPDKVFTFDEQQGITLGADVKVDYTAPGTYTAYGPPVAPRVPAGTLVDSHFLDSNQNGCPGTSNREGTWTFSQDILGVIVSRDRLTQSDYLGAPDTAYPGLVPSREFDFGGATPDLVQIVNSRTISVKLFTGTGGTGADQMRVITKHNAPPVASAGGPYFGSEGSSVTLGGSATDPDSDPMTKSWSFAVTASPGTSCTTSNTTTLTPSINCNDDALVAATLSVSDGYQRGKAMGAASLQLVVAGSKMLVSRMPIWPVFSAP